MDLEYQYLVGRLQETLAADPRVSTLDIKVVATGGRIHLIGEVPTHERRAAVIAVVHEALPGVQVRNELTVLELSGAPEPEDLRD
jgi:osmotically-inducible protein OsmY